jgi:hypothetical protein
LWLIVLSRYKRPVRKAVKERDFFFLGRLCRFKGYLETELTLNTFDILKHSRVGITSKACAFADPSPAGNTHQSCQYLVSSSFCSLASPSSGALTPTHATTMSVGSPQSLEAGCSLAPHRHRPGICTPAAPDLIRRLTDIILSPFSSHTITLFAMV